MLSQKCVSDTTTQFWSCYQRRWQ